MNHEDQRFFQFEIIINVLVSSSRFICIPMLCVYGHYQYFTFSVWGSTDFRRQTLDVIFHTFLFHFQLLKTLWIFRFSKISFLAPWSNLQASCWDIMVWYIVCATTGWKDMIGCGSNAAWMVYECIILSHSLSEWTPVRVGGRFQNFDPSDLLNWALHLMIKIIVILPSHKYIYSKEQIVLASEAKFKIAAKNENNRYYKNRRSWD